MKYTIKSLAEELNLSRNTVAKVLSGKDGVSPKTKKLVLEKIKELDLAVPEPISQRTAQPSPDDAVLLLIPEHSQHADFRDRLIRTLEKELLCRGYRLITEILKSSGSTISESSEPIYKESSSLVLPEIVFHDTVKGLIIAGVSDAAFCDQLCSLPISIIDFSKSCLPYKGRFDLITLDTTTAFQQAASIFQSDSIQNITLQSPIEQMGTAAVRCVTDRIREPLLPHLYMEYIPSLILDSTSARCSRE